LNLCVTTYEKLFKLVLNTILAHYLYGYVARPVLALALKGDKFTDPDGKSLKRSCLMAMERKETMSYHQAPFFRKTSFTLVISK
jgi:hypothetical protein